MNIELDRTKKYLLAVSGGIDSMVLLHWYGQNKIKFSVAHCNFSLRGNESDEDENLVKSYCQDLDIPFFTKKFDTEYYAQSHSLSIQESARVLRYTYFDELLNSHDFDFLVTAHHLDDNIETVLFHFLRGTGLKGLTGIPKLNSKIIRPLLFIEKSSIINYAKQYLVPFRNDSSNLKNEYTRNKLRNEIIPQLEIIFPTLKQNLAKNIVRFHETNEIYENAIRSLTKKLIEKRGKDFYIPILKLKNYTPLQTITYELIKPFQFSFEHAIELLKLLDSQSGVFIENREYKIVKNRNFFIITKIETIESEMILIDKDDSKISTSDFDLIFKAVSHVEKKGAPDLSNEFIDADQLQYPLQLRKWKQGDYLYPLGMLKKKKVSRVLIDAKISLPEKDRVWVLESNKKIVWIVGLKLDNRFKIVENTKRILSLQCVKK